MNTLRNITATLMTVVVTVLLAVPALAQEDIASHTLTEQQINDSYRLNNPRRAAISDMSVDLQPNQVVINATHTGRNNTVVTSTTMVPSVSDGRVYWEVTSVVTDSGVEAPAELLEQVNTWIAASWRVYIKQQYPGIITDVIVTDTDITYYYRAETAEAFNNAVDTAVENGVINEQDTPRAWEWWNRSSNGN